MSIAYVPARVGWGSYFGTSHRLEAHIRPVPDGLVGLTDLSVVTGGYFRVVSRQRGVLTWTGILLASPTTSLVKLGYAYADGDLTVPEQLVVTPIVQIPGDVVDCVPFVVSVHE